MKTKRKINISALFFNVLLAFIVAAFAGSTIVAQYPMSDAMQSMVQPVLFIGIMALAFVPKRNILPYHMSAIQPEIWAQDIAANVFPSSEFFNQSRDDSQYLQGKTVHLPQSGAPPSVEKNRSVLPATVSQRTDTLLDYDIDEFTTDPILLQDTEAIEASYDKRQSILFDHTEILRQKIGDNIIVQWEPTLATNQVRTSGSSRSAYVSGQTGNRKALAKADIIEANRLMNRMDTPADGRIMVISADLYADLLGISDFQSWDKMGITPLVNGAVGQILGFTVYVRSSAGRYDNTATPVKKAYGASVAAADNLAALCYHKMYVRRASGSLGNAGIKVYENTDRAEWYGSIFSAKVRSGGTMARTDEKGVVAIIETAV